MYKVAIITASDKGYAGEREDKSGSTIEEIVTAHELEVTGKVILPDDRQMLSDQMLNYCHQGIDLILTTGGTGFSKRDVTPEATADIIERRADNLTFAMIANSLQYTPKAMLSRGIAGIRENTLIVNLPGSPKAVRENLEYAIDAIIHGVKILKGDDAECARKQIKFAVQINKKMQLFRAKQNFKNSLKNARILYLFFEILLGSEQLQKNI